MTDQNLSGLISTAVAAKMTPEFIEKEVDTRVGKLVAETIDRAFRSYSDLHKLIENAVTEALKVERLDLPSYGSMVATMLKTQIEATVAPVIAGRLAEDMEALLKLAPKEIKLSEIAKEMLDHHGEDAWGQKITCHVEEAYSGSRSMSVFLDDRSHYPDHKASREAAHRLHVDEDGKILSAIIDRRPMVDTQLIGPSYGIAQKIRAYVACGTRIILDQDDVVTSAGDF